MTHVLLALALISASANVQQQQIQEQYQKLSGDERQLVTDTFSTFTVRIYRPDGSEVRKATGVELDTLTDVDLTCNKEILDLVWNGVVVTTRPLADEKVKCVNGMFATRHLPYNARLDLLSNL